MPNGHTHLVVNLGSGIPVLLATSLFLAPTNNSAIVIAAGYIWGTLFASPDLDVNGMDASEEHVGKLAHFMGPQAEGCLARVYHWLWLPYSLAMPHRGLGHFPLIGTALRMGYFVTVLLLGLLLFRHLAGFTWFPDIPTFISTQGLAILSFYIGWELASLAHIVADHIIHSDGHHPKFYLSKR